MASLKKQVRGIKKEALYSLEKGAVKRGAILTSKAFAKTNFSEIKKAENYLEILWEKYQNDVADSVLPDGTPEAKKAFLKSGKTNWANKGREFEFKIFFITGNIGDFDPTDNLARYMGGDITVEIEIDGKKKILDAQLKAEGARFSLPKDLSRDHKAEAVEKLEESMQKFSAEGLANKRYQEKFQKILRRLGNSLKYSKKISGVSKSILRDEVRASGSSRSIKNLKSFMRWYLALSSADYYLLGLRGTSDFAISIPHEQFLNFVDGFDIAFYPEHPADGTVEYKWQPHASLGETKAFTTLLAGAPSQQYHLHSVYGQKHFTDAKEKAWKVGKSVDERKLRRHYNFLLSNFALFEEPHLAFFGRDYLPEGELRKKV